MVGSIVLDDSMPYYKAFLAAVGGPNALVLPPPELVTEEDYPLEIMHETIAFWNKDQIDYLFAQGVDLEQRDIRGETAVLVARRSNAGDSEFNRVNYLLDRGANPHAVDNQGKGLCNFAKQPSNWDKTFPNQRTDLKRRLLTRYGMDCNDSKVL